MALTWETAADWDGAASEDGVVHESVANTDHDDDTIVKQGYSFTTISPQPASLRGYWPMHEDSGTTLNDLSGNANDGGINGPTLGITGILGTTGFSFDGSNDYCHLPTSYTTSGEISQVTVTAWVNVPSAGGDWGIIDYDRSEYYNTAAGVPDGSNSGEGDFAYFGSTDSGGTTHDMWGNTAIRDGSWHFLAWVYDGTDKIIYLDGTEDARASNPHGGSNLGTGTDRFAIIGNGSEAGVQDGSQNSNFYEGSMMELREYTTALTSTEIQTMYDVVNTQGQLITASKTI